MSQANYGRTPEIRLDARRQLAQRLDAAQGDNLLLQIMYDFYYGILTEKWPIAVWIASALFIFFYGWSHGLWIPALLAAVVIGNRTLRKIVGGLVIVLAILLGIFELCRLTGVIHVSSTCIPFTGICPGN